MIFQIFQLQRNKTGNRELQSWTRISISAYLPAEFNPEKVPYDYIQHCLDQKHCSMKCMHRYKIMCDTMQNKQIEIFRTPEAN